jgi:hypothetical protein
MNNPLKYRDPTGHSLELATMIGLYIGRNEVLRNAAGSYIGGIASGFTGTDKAPPIGDTNLSNIAHGAGRVTGGTAGLAMEAYLTTLAGSGGATLGPEGAVVAAVGVGAALVPAMRFHAEQVTVGLGVILAQAPSSPETGDGTRDPPDPSAGEPIELPENQVHGNSKDSAKPQHGYEIYEIESGDVAKTGISGQPLNKDGTSPRANKQVNQFNKEAGFDKYAPRVTKKADNRLDISKWEEENAERLRQEGHKMDKHQKP